MRMIVPLAVVMALVSSAAMAEGPSSTPSANAKYAADGVNYRYSRITMPSRVGGQDSLERRQLASRAAALINGGDCKGARRIAAKRDDYLMVVRIDQVCAKAS
uniref:UrcA family protein n=1 Tax=Caulobacter sp. (strain K31) TaxID=366602 RepID=B0T8U9_CAUSK